tara:strand:+ start:639 stop:869 length:231 start_codon:yes stop_codon:yes gene_type:complete
VALEIEEHIEELCTLRDAAKGAGDYGGAIEAERLRGVACGFYPQMVGFLPERKLSREEKIATFKIVGGGNNGSPSG